MDPNDIVNTKIGMLKIQKYLGTKELCGKKRHIYKCKCKCGNITEKVRGSLIKVHKFQAHCGCITGNRHSAGRKTIITQALLNDIKLDRYSAKELAYNHNANVNTIYRHLREHSPDYIIKAKERKAKKTELGLNKINDSVIDKMKANKDRNIRNYSPIIELTHKHLINRTTVTPQ
jgi:DNA-binding transcriptional regulator YhcF (GntR family)